MAYQKLPLNKKGFRAVPFWTTSSSVKMCLLLALQVYVNPSVWFFFFPWLYRHILFVCAATESFLANTNRSKLPVLCLVSLFLFKLLAKALRVFLLALHCFSLIRLGATGKGKLRKKQIRINACFSKSKNTLWKDLKRMCRLCLWLELIPSGLDTLSER